jgi:hypothetical protein
MMAGMGDVGLVMIVVRSGEVKIGGEATVVFGAFM